MITAQESYLAHRSAATLTEDTPPKEAVGQMRRLVSLVQHQVLSEQTDDLRRQLGGILFAHALRQFDLLDAFAEPKVWTREQTAPAKRRLPRGLLLGLSIALYLLCAIELYRDGEILWMAAFALCGVAMAAFFLTKPQKPPAEHFATQRMDPGALFAMVEGSLRAIDRDMEALDALLPPEEAGGAQPDVLDLMALLIEKSRNGTEAISPEVMSAVEGYLVRQGITLVDYTDRNAPLFQTLPTQRETKTLVPAMLQGDRLARGGMAVVNGLSLR